MTALIERLNDHDELERRIAIAELVGEQAVMPSLDALSDSRPFVRGGAAAVLAQLSSLAASHAALPLLINLLGDECEYVQSCAADALTQFDDLAEPLLIDALSEATSPLK